MIDRRSRSSTTTAHNPEKAAEGDTAETKAARTKQRLAAALRENLHRRKAQQRGRHAAEDQRKVPD